MATLLQDIRYALRMLRKSKAFTMVVALSLGLGIGINSTIFSFVNAVLFRAPAVEKPGELVEVWQHVQTANGFASYPPLTYPDFDYLRRNNHVFSGMIGFESEFGSVSWNHGDQSENLQGQLVSGNYFSVLGVNAALGRTITTEDDRAPGASPVVVLRNAFWQQRFAADPAIVGKALTLNGHNFTIVGVAARKFDGMLIGFAPDFWVPISSLAAIKPSHANFTETRDAHWLMAAGRLRSGVTREQANAEIGLLAQQIQKQHPDTNKNLTAVVVPADLTPVPMRGVASGLSALIMAIVGLVLLIACANVTNLSLAQAVRRQSELAVRAALGASRSRVIRQMLTESVLLACLGGAVGVLIAIWGAPLLLALKPSFLPISVDVAPDWRVLLFTLALSIVAGVGVGIAPALRSTGNKIATGLNLYARAGSYSKSRLRNLLVVSQVSFGLLLLIIAGLCVRSLRNAHSVDPGFQVDHALVASFDLSTAGYNQERGELVEKQLLQRLGALPGVASVGFADHLPLGEQTNQGGFQVNGKDITFDFAAIGPGYLQSMGISLLKGRDFTVRDNRTGPPVLIVNDAFARKAWPNEDPLGKVTFLPGIEGKGEIIGVVRTGKYRSLGESPRPFIFVSMLQTYDPKSTVVVRTIGPPAAMVETIRREFASVDSGLAVEAQTLAEHLKLALFPAEATGALLGSFGLLALVLAIVGLYGMLAYSVSQRTREIGIRTALGAQSTDVLRLVMLQGLKLTAIGMAIGLVAALLSTRLLSFLLYGISATDPLTFAGVTAVFLGIAALAIYVPARRAAKVDPMNALRYE
jgi:predicted permease